MHLSSKREFNFIMSGEKLPPGQRSIQTNTLKPLPRGEDGLAVILDFQNALMVKRYPDLVHHMDRLVTRVDQVKWVPPTELERMAAASQQDRISYRLFSALGIPSFILREEFVEPGSQMQCVIEEGRPTLFLSRNSFNKLSDGSPTTRLGIALNIATDILEVNFNLLPVPKDTAEDLRRAVVRLGRMELDDSIKAVMLKSGDRVGTDELEVLEGVMHSLIYLEEPTYQPRVVSYGGLALVLLPHQTYSSAEAIVNGEFHKNVYNYLYKVIIEDLFAACREEGYANAPVALNTSGNVNRRSQSGAFTLLDLGVKDRNEALDLFVTSELADRMISKLTIPPDFIVSGSQVTPGATN